MEELKEVLHEKRKEIDAVIKSVKDLKLEPNSEQPYLGTIMIQREVSLSYTRLQEAKMWIGKALEALGSELPVEFQDEA